MIEQTSIEQLLQKTDIVDIIAHYVEVKKQGSGYVCVCPFHDDKNPSMHINSIKGFYHCFACKAGGNVFKFVMDYEKLNFVEAVEKVASWSNFSLTYTSQKQDNKKSIVHILPSLNAFYKQNLSKNKEALAYLYKRGLNDEDIRKFELGYAPSSNETLRLLQNEQINTQEALEAGAIKQNESGIYASFINRITFSIYDHKNLLVGFGGRTLDETNMAKYVNSPQSKLFDKSRIFYALHLAKDEIYKQKEMIICEGYMDAIALHKAGFTNSVAVLGTALGENHIPLIKRLQARVILCFDNDNAGLNAALRSAHLLSLAKIDGKVVLIEGGKDPAELVATHQEKLLFSILEKGIELGEFYIRNLITHFDLNSALNKQQALEEVQKYTFSLEPLIANSYVNLVANLLGVNHQDIKLSKNTKTQNTFLKLRPQKQNFTNNISELELLKFLHENPNSISIFNAISLQEYFLHQDIIQAILTHQNFENASIRELYEYKNIKDLANLEEFLYAICKINLAFFNRLKNLDFTQALKKQIFNLLNQNLEKIKKIYQNEEIFLSHLNEILKTIQTLKDDELELFFINLQRNIKNKQELYVHYDETF
ncbi:DNA primase [Campylobacter volucris]|uniref:DNA primase n=1 Tax=Campylobacter volucris TaxID=1031542 RepID=A0AAE5YGP0_9BACT|nr:DNA primase [Campylobacter volucris]AJC94766.1 DNA primase [Campylobacter volucris LMG 24379]KAB0578248.1 DNA primase [Campylobacter volucris]QBL12891.1 DNA primase [Campylobacter volucris]QEL08983.1 DNA primase [Campylobacter volucris]TXK66972.1 DNA primase [Campylobacter volucris]